MSNIDLSEYIDLSGDGGLLKKIIKEGEGDFPKPLNEIEAHYTGTLDDGTVFDSSYNRNKPFKFTVGKGQVIKGWDKGFATMKKGEKAILRCRADYAYGDRPTGSIPANATLNFEVELLDFREKKKDRWDYNDEDKEKEGNELKEKGNQLFKEKNYNDAIAAYLDAADLVGEVAHLAPLFFACKLNAAQAFLNLTNYPDAIVHCNEVLKRDPNNVKGLYRRAVARNHLGLCDEAHADLIHLLQLDPTNSAAKIELEKAKKKIQLSKEKSKKAYGNFFSKLSVYDDKKGPVNPVANLNNPRVFFDVKQGDNYLGRLVMLLYEDVTPKTVKNFLTLCVGDQTDESGKPLSYKNSIFHRIIKGFMIQGGDFVNADGTGSASIYGGKFDDENFIMKHTEGGLLSMANSGPNTNGCQFFITSSATPHLDGKHVVFGKVIEGFNDVFPLIEGVRTSPNDRPLEDVVIVNCGLYDPKNPPALPTEA